MISNPSDWVIIGYGVGMQAGRTSPILDEGLIGSWRIHLRPPTWLRAPSNPTRSRPASLGPSCASEKCQGRLSRFDSAFGAGRRWPELVDLPCVAGAPGIRRTLLRSCVHVHRRRVRGLHIPIPSAPLVPLPRTLQRQSWDAIGTQVPGARVSSSCCRSSSLFKRRIRGTGA